MLEKLGQHWKIILSGGLITAAAIYFLKGKSENGQAGARARRQRPKSD
jgi:hypothetical protein